jgi:hypothetical protein
MLEEVDIRMIESKKDTREFKKDVVIGGENQRTGRTSSAKFIKHASSLPQFRLHEFVWITSTCSRIKSAY